MKLIAVYSYRTVDIRNVYQTIQRCYVQEPMAALMIATFGERLMDNHIVLEFEPERWDDEKNNPEHKNVFLSLSDSDARWGLEIIPRRKLVWQHSNEERNVWANAHTTKKVA